MAWWQRLLGIDTPAGTTLDAVTLSCRGPMPWWVALLIGLPLAAGAVWLYRRESVRIGWFRRGVLMALRMSLIALALFLLLRPVLVADFRGERPRAVVLLLDDSKSMQLKDRRLGPEDRLRAGIAYNVVPADAPLNPETVRNLTTLPKNP